VDPGPIRDVLTLLAGVGTGMLSAAFGVGGGVVSTPAVRSLGLSAELAIGTTLPSIFPSAVSGTLRYTREGLVDWEVVRLTVPAGIAASVGGSVLSHALPGHGHLLMVATALLLGFTAWRMGVGGRDPAPAEVAPPTAPAEPPVRISRRLALVLVGAVAGLLSGLLGIGGGVLMVPGFTQLARVPLKTAIASSLVCVGVFAVPGTITHHLLGGIRWWPWAALLAIGVVPGARLGAAFAIRMTDARLRRAVALFLGVISLLYLAGELSALAAS
jgi:uncharacterized membrane protein YfcA